MLATNVGEIVAIFFGLLLGLDSPLLAIHLLWINLVTDSLPAIALGMEPMDKHIMKNKPKGVNQSLFADGLWGKIFVEGAMIGILTLLAFSIGNKFYGLTTARTMAFASLSMLELVHSINIKTERSLFKTNIFNNLYLLGAIIIGIILQVFVTAIPAVCDVFEVTSLNLNQWAMVIGISILPIILVELQKKINEIKFGKRVFAKNN